MRGPAILLLLALLSPPLFGQSNAVPIYSSIFPFELYAVDQSSGAPEELFAPEGYRLEHISYDGSAILLRGSGSFAYISPEAISEILPAGYPYAGSINNSGIFAYFVNMYQEPGPGLIHVLDFNSGALKTISNRDLIDPIDWLRFTSESEFLFFARDRYNQLVLCRHNLSTDETVSLWEIGYFPHEYFEEEIEGMLYVSNSIGAETFRGYYYEGEIQTPASVKPLEYEYLLPSGAGTLRFLFWEDPEAFPKGKLAIIEDLDIYKPDVPGSIHVGEDRFHSYFSFGEALVAKLIDMNQ
jgi:hypothetical protein